MIFDLFCSRVRDPCIFLAQERFANSCASANFYPYPQKGDLGSGVILFFDLFCSRVRNPFTFLAQERFANSCASADWAEVRKTIVLLIYKLTLDSLLFLALDAPDVAAGEAVLVCKAGELVGGVGGEGDTVELDDEAVVVDAYFGG